MAAIDHQLTFAASPAIHEKIRVALGGPRLQRKLITRYFDTPDLLLHRSGATFRKRASVGSASETVEAKVPTKEGLLRTSGDEAASAIAAISGDAPLDEVAQQTKVRQLHFLGHPRLGRLAPDVVVALDHATITTGPVETERVEVELQIFTKLPWTAKVDSRRLARFQQVSADFANRFALLTAEVSGYQAIDLELMR